MTMGQRTYLFTNVKYAYRNLVDERLALCGKARGGDLAGVETGKLASQQVVQRGVGSSNNWKNSSI